MTIDQHLRLAALVDILCYYFYTPISFLIAGLRRVLAQRPRKQFDIDNETCRECGGHQIRAVPANASRHLARRWITEKRL